ncbi:hypothetical protein M885DRAFT_439357 [Pelagophyceae sp. CCMP2097]|nr:hypothetical protein M885DRAFT_439357 [Pelagophyceae sp. CCMP2097]
MKALPQLLGIAGGKANLRFADEATLADLLGVGKGAVSPYAVINDAGGQVTLAVDASLLAPGGSNINTHPLRCDRTVSASPEGLAKFLAACGHEPILLHFDDAAVAAPAAPAAKKPKAEKAPKSDKAPKATAGAEAENSRNKKGSKETLDRIISTKEGDFARWYTEVITKSEMIEYGQISGCYVLRPWSFGIWEKIQQWFDARIKEDLEVENCYFPMFVTKAALEAEEDHVEGFAPEVAWVTRSGNTDLPEPIAVRPTSETIMYPEFAKWLRSHRDLPLKLNQWCSVVRWEFKDPTPFLRSREFLWQEGHTAHMELAEADEMVFDVLKLYKRVYEDLLAVPVIPGTKTEHEKFAGGLRTTTVEAYIAGSGRAIQGATSHNLGQNFGKIYGIEVETADQTKGAKSIPWQTSWGLTTRSIGVMVMVHGDDQGLVLPPRVAPVQAVIVPILSKASPLETLQPFIAEVVAQLKAAGVRVKVDLRTNQSPGWKFNHWEQKGVPLRIEIGPRDVSARSVLCVKRVDGVKASLAVEGIGATIAATLDAVHDSMLAKARAARDSKLVQITTWAEFVPALDANCLILAPWCDPMNKDAEEGVKEKSRAEALERHGLDSEDARTATSLAAKTLCVPHDQPDLPPGTKCFFTGLPATCWVLWGRSY